MRQPRYPVLMVWAPIKSPLADLLALHARVERLRVVDQIKSAEMQLQAAGMDPTPLMNIRRGLLAEPIGKREAIFTAPDVPPVPPPDTKRPLKHLRVQDRTNV